MLYSKPLIIDNEHHFFFDTQGETGEDLVKLKYTRASAVKEKDGKVLCQGEVLCDGKHWGDFILCVCVCMCVCVSVYLFVCLLY